MDINKYTANANKLLVRLLNLAVNSGGCICCMNGGTAHNAIPMDAEACVNFDTLNDDQIDNFIFEA